MIKPSVTMCILRREGPGASWCLMGVSHSLPGTSILIAFLLYLLQLDLIFV